MNWIPHISSGYFAIAGLICAAGPVLIHLLNRRRFRVVEWAAMDFLFAALQRQKRRLKMRDLILLVLRTTAVLFFGLALARPYLTSDGSLVDANSPRHLIVLIDNSLSMGYRPIDTTLLEQAKRQASQLIESLPRGSQITIIGTCGNRDFPEGPIRRKTDALDRLTAIPLVDSVSRLEDVLAAARNALATALPLADQLIYFTDLQRSNWPADIEASQFDHLPTLQIRDMSGSTWENTWVSDVRLNDDVVNLDTPATVFVTVRHQGSTSRRTQVSLSIHDSLVATRSIEFSPGTTERQIAFECSFADAAVEPGDAAFVPLQVSLTPDRLTQDNHRTMMVPVVTSLPVVFVDQYSDENEDPVLGQLGETRPLRHLLAPRTATSSGRPLVDVRHVTIAETTRELLAPARLVVVAGISDPRVGIDVLRQYVYQGGPLVIAAGGDFDPHGWNQVAGPNGAGLLPGQISEQPWGMALDEATDALLAPFSLALDSLASDPIVRLPGLSDEEMREIYLEPLFFKTVVLNLASTENRPPKQASDATPPSTPRWLSWKSPTIPLETTLPNSGNEPIRPRPNIQVCARFDDASGAPFLVRHRVGQGEVLFCSTSILPTWNNLAQTNAMVLWDHVLRSLIRSTLPQRNFLPQDQLAIPIPIRGRGMAVRLQRPEETSRIEFIDVGFIEKDQRGVIVSHAWTRGLYRLDTGSLFDEESKSAGPAWQLEIAVNGDARESDLSPLPEEEFQERVVNTGFGQLFEGNSLGALDGGAHGNAMWWWLVLAVFVLLGGELVLLALSNRRGRLKLKTDD